MGSQRVRYSWAHGIILWDKHHQWLVGWFYQQQGTQCSYHFLLVKYSLILSFEYLLILPNLIIADWFPDFLCFMLTQLYHNQSVLPQFKMQMKIHNTSPKYNACTLPSTFKQWAGVQRSSWSPPALIFSLLVKIPHAYKFPPQLGPFLVHRLLWGEASSNLPKVQNFAAVNQAFICSIEELLSKQAKIFDIFQSLPAFQIWAKIDQDL